MREQPITKMCECECGQSTVSRFRRGHNARARTEETLRKIGEASRRKVMSSEARAKISRATSDDRNPAWLGDAAGYSAVHNWIRKRKIKTGCCQNCGAERHTQWANVSREYRRELEDFVELCVPCHKRYDLYCLREENERLKAENAHLREAAKP
jgi:hypothetical protein